MRSYFANAAPIKPEDHPLYSDKKKNKKKEQDAINIYASVNDKNTIPLFATQEEALENLKKSLVEKQIT
jgi:hypothetical protein